MLIFELNCKVGHAFEGWFDSLHDLEEQLAQGKLSCPMCGSKKVQRVLSAFAIGKKAEAGGAPACSELGMNQASQMIQKAAYRYLAENFENVGTSFFNEALKMHYGAAKPRNICGVSSGQEEEILRQEGVDFFKINHDTPSVPSPPEQSAKLPKTRH